ncbi:MAG TPA: hypothetical protein DIW81_05320 [Planctomycetaceae bacterium]|uniref:alpha/beta hydrolase n=1 Tax=Rubinisphaera sp. TaxID=2024857 RepID=UPI000C0F3F5A|nr:alpha/beta hydrolase [Rubinisphaera sp.]MBV11878.1 hypothetical protein [Rubinisphaera sp.]HCS51001.1 hypothetical protein [Planctomycetaceae bacterium]
MSLFNTRSRNSCSLIMLFAVSISMGTCCDTFAQRNKQQDAIQKLRQLLLEKSSLHRDLEYARVDNRSLKLNLAIPNDATSSTPLVIWIHGGGWNSGSKDAPSPAVAMLLVGYAVASIEYRFLDDAPFPAQIHDAKAAVRWLRANAGKYNIDPDKFAVWGASAGGHLASLLGTSGGVEDLEGTVGNHVGVSSRVQVVCNYYGPTDLTFWFGKDGNEFTLPGKLAEVPSKMFRTTVRDRQAEAEIFSPISYVSREDPPVIIVQGDKDPIVMIEHNRGFVTSLKENRVKVEAIVLAGAGHGGKEFMNPNLLKRLAEFFNMAW